MTHLGISSPTDRSDTGLIDGVDQPPRYAGFWIRAAAFILDYILFIAIGFVPVLTMSIVILAMHGDRRPEMVDAIERLVAAVLSLTYSVALCASPWQATLGKRILGVYVRTADGRRLRPRHAFGRELAKTLSALTLTLGYMMAGWTREKTALHDVVARTRVVYGKVPVYQRSTDAASKPKSPAVALIWSIVISGGGQFYNREFVKGLAFLVANIALWAVWLGWLPLIWSIADAYDTANRKFPTISPNG